jgi:hypothetical protein
MQIRINLIFHPRPRTIQLMRAKREKARIVALEHAVRLLQAGDNYTPTIEAN